VLDGVAPSDGSPAPLQTRQAEGALAHEDFRREPFYRFENRKEFSHLRNPFEHETLVEGKDVLWRCTPSANHFF